MPPTPGPTTKPTPGGNRAEALLAYEELRQRLRDELGVGPSAETVEAHRRLLA